MDKYVLKDTCVIYNFAQHYREGIFSKLDNLSCDFYFGNKTDDIKKIDYSNLKNFKGELNNIYLLKNIYWQTGAISLLFKNYSKYIFLGEFYCISTWIFLILASITKKKVFLWTHGWYGNEGFLKKIIKKIFFRFSDGLFLYGNYAKSLMIEQGFKKEKLHVIFNSLNYEKQFLLRSKLKSTNIYKDYFQNSNPVLIFIGRLNKVKKLEMILNAIKNLNKKGLRLNLIFIGQGDQKKFLKDMSKKLKIKSQVWFYGSVYNEVEIAELVYNADICVSPGNVGLTAMHSLVYGTPVITNNDFKSQMPEFEAIKQNKTGNFFLNNDLKSLESVIFDWIKINLDNRKNIREFCYKVIDEKYNPNYQLKVIKKALKDVQ